METAFLALAALASAVVCAFGIGWWLANTGGLWHTSYETNPKTGKSELKSVANPRIAWVSILGMIAGNLHNAGRF